MTNASDPRGTHEWHDDAYVQEWISGWDGAERRAELRRMAHHIPFDPDQEIRVLDIGGGWGPITSTVLESFPQARVTLHDFSAPMISQARQRLANYSDSVSYVQSDLMTPAWKENIEGDFDAIVSCLCIHNVRFPDRVHSIYNELFALVKPGGCFVSLDLANASGLASRAAAHARVMARRAELFDQSHEWRSYAEVEAMQPARRGGGREQAPEVVQRMASHEPATLANQLRWLTDAGFDAVECFERDGNMALIGAYRA